MLGFQVTPQLFSAHADVRFCLCSSEYAMSAYVIFAFCAPRREVKMYAQLK